MNKKLKIVSTLGLAGIMSLGTLASTTLATNITSRGRHQILGHYASLDGIEDAVPVVLDNSANKNYITPDEIKEKFATASDFSKTERLGTGDTFKVSGSTYTVVLFGDVNGDGYVNSIDATAMQNEYFKATTPLKGANKVAADVAGRDTVINSVDATRVMNYYFKSQKTVVDKILEEVDATCTLATDAKQVVSDYYVNNQNEKEVKLTVTPNNPFNKETSFKVYVNGSAINPSKTITLAANQTENSVVLDLSNYADGELVVQLVNDEESIVAKTTLKKNTIEPKEEVLVSTTRTDSKNGTAKFTYYGENDASKVYYVVDNSEKYSGSVADLVNSQNFGSNTATVSTSDLEAEKAGYIHYVLEDKYGNKTKSVLTSAIAKDSAKALSKVTDMTEPTAENNKFTWKIPEGETSNKLQVTIYKDSEITEVKELSANTTSYAFTPTEAGTYKIDVKVLAKDVNQKDSVVETSQNVTVEALEVVSAPKLEVGDDGKYTISWTDESNSEDDVDNYEVKLYVAGTENELTGAITNISKEDKKAEIVTDKLAKNTLYDVKIVAKANKDNVLLLDSEETALNNSVFVIDLGLEASTIKSNSITLTVTDKMDDPELDPTYTLEVYEIKTDTVTGQTSSSLVTAASKEVEISEDNTIEVTGLTPDTKYAFKLKVTINDIEGASKDYIGKDGSIKTLGASVNIQNLTVVGSKDECTAGSSTIYFDGSKVYIDGKEYDVANMKGKYEDAFVALMTYVSKLNLYEGDKITTATADELSLELAESESNADSIVIPGTVETVSIKGNDHQRRLSFAAGNKNKVTLTGTTPMIAISSNKPSELSVSDGAKVEGEVAYDATLLATGTVTLNGKSVKANAKTTFSVDNSSIAINVDGTSDTNYEFGNTDGKDLTVSLKSVNNNGTDIQAGTIKITANGGTITVKAEPVSVTGVITVDIQKDTILVLNDKFITGTAGNKMTITDNGKSATVKVTSKENSPETLNGIAVNADATAVKEHLGLSNSNDDNARVTKVTGYLGGLVTEFGIKNDENTKITVAKDSNDVTIEFVVEE